MRKNLPRGAAFLGFLLLTAGCGDKTVSTPSGPDAPASPDVSGAVLSPLGSPVAAASVVATDGPLAGRATTTDEGGQFLLSGVQSANGVTLRVSKAGYQERTWAAVPASQPASNLRVILWPAGHADAAPRYTLSLTADPACTDLPADVRVRRYTAALDGDEGSITHSFIMQLAGAEFYPTQRVIWGEGGASEGQVKVYILSREVAERWLDEGPIVESLGGTRYLAMSGTAVMTVSGPVQSLTAALEGTFSYCARGAPNDVFFECAVPPVKCRSSNHQLTIAPQ